MPEQVIEQTPAAMRHFIRVPQVYYGTPFRYSLKSEFAGKTGKIMRLARDGRVVRAYSGLTDGELSNLRTFTRAMSCDGIKVPDYGVVRGPRLGNKTRPGLYIVCDWVVGERLDQINGPAQIDWDLPLSRRFYTSFYQKLDDFLLRLLQHYERLLESGGLVFAFMDESQFVYGRCRAEQEPFVYFVDLDPSYKLVPPFEADNPRQDRNEFKSDFEKPINILFEMKLLHPDAALEESTAKATRYFRECSRAFANFYSENTPWWARSPNFAAYQAKKRDLMLDT